MLIEAKEIQQVSNEVMNMLHDEELEVINDFYDAVVAKDIDKIHELFKVVLFDVEAFNRSHVGIFRENRCIFILLPLLRIIVIGKT